MSVLTNVKTNVNNFAVLTSKLNEVVFEGTTVFVPSEIKISVQSLRTLEAYQEASEKCERVSISYFKSKESVEVKDAEGNIKYDKKLLDNPEIKDDLIILYDKSKKAYYWDIAPDNNRKDYKKLYEEAMQKAKKHSEISQEAYNELFETQEVI